MPHRGKAISLLTGLLLLSAAMRAQSGGSSYVPLQSWVYSALDRLAATGLVGSANLGLRPWTRADCRRQLAEADARLEPGTSDAADARALVRALHGEFDREEDGATSVVLESVYFRNGAVAGPLVNDSMHFGQTWSNDQGRPFGRGWNSYTGIQARAQSGRFFGALEAEVQRAPGEAAYPLSVRQLISQLDQTPVAGPEGRQSTERLRVMEGYAGVRLGAVQFSAGQQAMWWGPEHGSPLSFSSNAEPTRNFKISMVHPARLPGVLARLGSVRGEFVIGKLGGQTYTRRPWFNAQKLSFLVTENLELGFTRWSIFWGVGHPMTMGSLIRNFTSVDSPIGEAGVGRSDPGDRKAGFDFRYRVPGLRNWVTIYSDSYSDDDPSPLAAPRRAAINPGIRLVRVPGIERLELRVEAPSTTPLGGDQGGRFMYYNNMYRSGNTNYGKLLGSPVGRDARAIQGWITYWFSARNTLEVGYSHAKGSAVFLPGGSTISDGTARASAVLGRDWYAQVLLQYERFLIPVLGGAHSNVSGWVQLSWEPKWQWTH